MQLAHVRSAEDLHFVQLIREDESFQDEDDERKEDAAFIPHYVLTQILEKLAASEIGEESVLETLELSRNLLWSFCARISAIEKSGVTLSNSIEEVEVTSVELAVALTGAAFLGIDSEDQRALTSLRSVGESIKELLELIDGMKGSNSLSKVTMDLVDSKITIPCKQLFSVLTECPGLNISMHPTTTEARVERVNKGTQVPQNLNSMLDKLHALMAEKADHEEQCAKMGLLLMELSRKLRHRDKGFFGGEELLDRLYDTLIELLSNSDSYVFLTAINALAELSMWWTEPYFGRLVDHFSRTEITSDADLMHKSKMGEVLAKICRELGDFSPFYFDKLSNAMLAMVKPANDELVQASALGSLSNLVLACRGHYFDRIFQELLLCIFQLLSTAKHNLIRRSAIHLLRSMLASAASSKDAMFETFASSLSNIARQLKVLWTEDRDDVVRLHAELALIEIEDALKEVFNVGTARRII